MSKDRFAYGKGIVRQRNIHTHEKDKISDDDKRQISEYIATHGVTKCAPGASSEDEDQQGSRRIFAASTTFGARRQRLGAHLNSRERMIRRNGGLLDV